MSTTPATHERQAISLFQRDILTRALVDSFKKLDPRVQVRNPVMFVVEIGAVITTMTWLIQAFGGKPLGGGHEPAWYTFTIAFWLWLTVIFANMAEAFAEGRGRAQADTLRSMRKETVATMRDGSTKAASELTRGDVVVVEAGELIPGDGTVIEGIATVNESAITGESAPVIRESGGDRSAVTGGTRVTSDRIVVEITQEPGHSFLDRMIALVRVSSRHSSRVTAGQVPREKLPALQQHRQPAHNAKSCCQPRQHMRPRANRRVRVHRHRPHQQHRPSRQCQLQTQVAEAHALQRGVHAAAPSRPHQRAPPPRLQHRVRAPARMPRLHRQAAQKIRRCPAREEQHRQPQRHHPHHRKIREVHVLDDAVSQNVNLRAHRRGHLPRSRQVSVQRIQRDRRHRQRHRQQVHPRAVAK